jgi:chorismate-pyruvate lyase
VAAEAVADLGLQEGRGDHMLMRTVTPIGRVMAELVITVRRRIPPD